LDQGHTNQTNSSGYANLYFDPDCSYSVGPQTWYAKVTDAYYENNITPYNLTVIVKDDILITVTGPVNVKEYPRGDNITVNVSLQDRCGRPIEGAEVNITMIHNLTGTVYHCNGTIDIGNGLYNCTFNTSDMKAGLFHISVSASKQYYNSNSSIEYNAFWIETKPVLTLVGYGVTPQIGGWGAKYTFTVNVTDEDGDIVRVYLYEREYGSDTWNLVPGPEHNYQEVSGINKTVTFILDGSIDYTCAVLGGKTSVIREFKFNATDDPPGPDDIAETEPRNFTVERDSVRVDYVDGDDVWIYRPSGNYTLKLRFFDLDTGNYVNTIFTQGFFNITQNGPGSNYISYDVSSDAQGYISLNFDPGCSPKYSVGPQKWLGGTKDDTCYKDNSSEEFDLYIWTSPLQVNLTIPDGEHYRRGIDNISIRGYVHDECGAVTNATVTITAESGAFTFSCEDYDVIHDEGLEGGEPGWYNCTFWWNNHSSWPNQVLYKFNTTMKASKLYYNDSPIVIDEDSFWLTDVPDVYWDDPWHTVYPTGGGWGALHTFSFYVRDEENDEMNITFWKKTGDNGTWILINQTTLVSDEYQQVEFKHRFTCEDANQVNYFMINITDSWNDYTESEERSFYMDKDRTTAYAIIGDDSIVAREGSNSVQLQVRIRDTDIDPVGVVWVDSNVSGRIWVTYNNTGSNTWDEGIWNVTTSGGYLTVYFDPGCDPLYVIGEHDWKGGVAENDTCYAMGNSTNNNVSIIGQLKNFLQLPEYGENIPVGNLVFVRYNITGECGELVNGSTTTLEFGSPKGEWESFTPLDEGNGWYNYTWDTSFHIGGWWDIRINSSKSWYYFNSSTWEDWIYLNNTPPELTNISVTPQIGGWGDVFTYRVDINDTQQDNVTCELYVSTDGGNTWVKKNSTIVYGGQSPCILTVSDFTCSEIGTDNKFYFSTFDGTNVKNTSIYDGPNITVNNASIAYIYSDPIVNRDDTQENNTALIIVYVHDLTRNTSAREGTNVTIRVEYKNGTFDYGKINQTNSSGYMKYYFNPGCDFPLYDPGVRKWYANVTDYCYDNPTTDNYTITIYGTLVNSFVEPAYGTNYERGVDDAYVKGYVQDDCGNFREDVNVTFTYIHESNTTMYECTPVQNDTGGYYSCTRNSSDMLARFYDVVMNSSRDYFLNDSERAHNLFFIKTKPVLEDVNVTPNPGGWGERFYFSVNLTDEDLDNVTVNLYIRKKGSATWGAPKNSTYAEAPINYTVTLSWSYPDCLNIGDWEFYFEAIDNRTLSTVSEISNFTMERDDVNLTLAEGDGVTVMREGSDEVWLRVIVYDTDRGTIAGSNVNGTFWVTTNASDPNSWDVGRYATTNGSSYMNYNFPTIAPQPDCDYSVGVHKWKAGVGGLYSDQCYKDANSSEFTLTIISNLKPTIVSPRGDSFIRGTPVPISGFITDECGPVEGVLVKYSIYLFPNYYNRTNTPEYNDSGQWQEGDGWYNYTWLDTNRQTGWYDLFFVTLSKPYYVMNETYLDDAFFLALPPVLSDPGVDPYSDGWGKLRTFTIKVTDNDLNYNNVTLWKRKYDPATGTWGNWTFVDYIYQDQLQSTWLYFYERFACSDMGLNEFRFITVDEFGYSDDTRNYITNVSKTIHNSSQIDSGFNYTEYISDTGYVEYFNITIANTGNQTFYFNLTVNDLLIAENYSLTNGTNITINAMMNDTNFDLFVLPGDNYINITIMNSSGERINASYIVNLSYISGIQTFYVEPDSVAIEICQPGYCSPYSNSTVRRLGGNQAFLNFRIYDADYPRYPNGTKGMVWITRDNQNYDFNLSCTSLNGYCEVYYNPDCTSTVGLQKWIGGTFDSCYQYLNSSETDLYVYGQLYVNAIEPEEYAILNRNTTAELNASVYTDCSGEIVYNAKVSWYNSSMGLLNYTIDNTTNFFTSTFLVPETQKLGPETIYTNATKPYYDMGTNTTLVYIFGWSTIDSITPENGSEYSAGTMVPVTCHISDLNTGESIEGYEVKFYKNGVLQQISNTNAQGSTTWYWDTENETAGYYNISCIIEDDPSKYYNASHSLNYTIIRIRRQLKIEEITLSNSWIYRNDSFSPHTTVITVYVNDADIGPANASNVSFYNSTSYMGSCITDETGHCNITYNASDDTIPGNYTIYINATKEGSEDSVTVETYILVYGILFPHITSPVNGSSYTTADSVDLAVDVYDENGNVVTGMDVEWWNETSMLVDTAYFNNYPLSGQSSGNRTFKANASKPYYTKGSDYVVIMISALADVIWVSPPNGSYVPYPEPFDAICQVRDPQTGSGISDYPVELYYYYTPPYIFLGNLTTNASGHINYTFTPTQKGEITFKCNITSDPGRLIEANIDTAIGVITIKDVTPPTISNISIVPNESIEANLDIVNITADVTDDIGVYQVWAWIGLPNGSYKNVSMSLLDGTTYRGQYVPPIDGTYNVTIFAQDMGPEYNINSSFAGYFHTWGRAYGRTSMIDEVPVSSITQIQGYSFDLTINLTNLGPPNMYDANITVYDSPENSLIFNDTFESCGDLAANETCSWTIHVTVPAKTPPSLIRIFANASWRNPELTTNFTSDHTDVIVASNPVIDIIEDTIHNITPHDRYTYVGTITVASIGNDGLENIELSLVGGDLALDCPECRVDLSVILWEYLAAGYNFTVDVYVDVPAGQNPRDYWTYIRASTTNAGFDDCLLNITVPLNTSWIRTPETFGTKLTQLNTEGVIGNITLSNTGNIKLAFRIYRTENGSSLVTVTPNYLTVEKQSSREVMVTYNIPPDQTEGLYYVQLFIRNDTATPEEMITDFWMNVTDLPPNISNVNVTPLIFEIIYENVSISAMITDNFNVSSAWIGVMRPGDVNYTNVSKILHNASQADSGLNHTEYISQEGYMQYFNITLTNTGNLTFYFNLSINGVLIAQNHSLQNGSTFSIDAVESGVSLPLPGNQSINLAIFDINSTPINASYVLYLNYSFKQETPFIKPMDDHNPYYNTTYNTNISGIHILRICANDTKGLTSCTSPIYLHAAGATPVLIEPNITSVSIENITMRTGEEFNFNFTLIPLYSRVYNLSVNISAPEGWKINRTYFTFGNLLKQSSRSNHTSIFVSLGTFPGTYLVNITANWTNLNGTEGYNITSIRVTILSNPQIDIVGDYLPLDGPLIIIGGRYDEAQIYVNSTGNDNATNIRFYCLSGTVCENFTVEFIPPVISYLPPGHVNYTVINVSVPLNFPAGPYWGLIKANITTGAYDTAIINVTVPINLSWTQVPDMLTKRVIQGTEGTLGYITITNVGNAYLRLAIAKSGNLSIFDINTTTLSLAIGESAVIEVTYTAPVVYTLTNYSAEIITINTTADPSTRSTFVEIEVHPYFVDIISPTEKQPLINVSMLDNIQVKVNVTYENSPVTSGLSWNLTLSHADMSIPINLTSAVYSEEEGLWLLNFTAPDLPIGTGYDLNVTAIYETIGISWYDYEPKSIVYADPYPPWIDIYVPPRVPANTTARIYANVTDPGGVKNASIAIIKPDNTTLESNMTFIERVGDIYRYLFDFTETDMNGIYTVIVTACDLSGNCNSTNTTFEIFPAAYFSGRMVDEEGIDKPPLNVTFILYYPGTETQLYNFTTDENGYYNETIDARTYDMFMRIRGSEESWKESLMLYGTEILHDVDNPILFGRIPGVKIGKSVLKAYYINETLNFSLGIFILNCTECYQEGVCSTSDFVLENLGIYYCEDWVPMTRCASGWTKLESILDPVTGTIQVNATNFRGAYALAEYICGDGVCESQHGESNAVCPSDCPIQIPPSGGGGGGAGGGAGGGVSVGAGAGTAGAGVGAAIPVKVKTTLIDVRLRQGEYEIHSMEIENNQKKDIKAKLSVEGLIWDFVQIENPEITIPPRSVGIVKIKLFTLPTTTPGIYTGDIVTFIEGMNITHRTPVTITVLKMPQPLLDVKIRVLTKTIEPGGNLKFELTLINMGETAKIEDIVVRYNIRNLQTDEVVTIMRETLAVEQTKTIPRNITLPEDMPYGRYYIEANVSYWNNRKFAYAADAFDVVELPPVLKALKAIFWNWITYLVLFAVVPGAYGSRLLYT
ncbi:hypothetical protein DRJ04_00800, partial [Candidatus Aerophobetes bacterium]